MASHSTFLNNFFDSIRTGSELELFSISFFPIEVHMLSCHSLPRSKVSILFNAIHYVLPELVVLKKTNSYPCNSRRIKGKDK